MSKSNSERCAQLRGLVQAKQLSLMMEAHNGLSAKVAERAGFKAIWASGLSISTTMGVRDSNELSWTQSLDVLEYMSDAASVPILFDGDTGYGNFNNARILVRKLEQRGIAGVVIEDKLFPKMNSFVGERQPLADIAEFQGKIRAMKDTQTCDDFQVVARVEALIAGQGMDEALRRAESYMVAGADAIFIHSKRLDADEILEFGRQWGRQCPLVVAPTTYSKTPLDALEGAGISVCICANQNMRAALVAMEAVCRSLLQAGALHVVEDQIASLREVFGIIGYEELEAANERYLPYVGN